MIFCIYIYDSINYIFYVILTLFYLKAMLTVIYYLVLNLG